MKQSEKKLGITLVLMEELEHKTLPDSLWIKHKVDQGKLLNDGDIEFLDKALKDAWFIKPLIDAQPEWQSLFAGAINLYEGITAKALENQRATEYN